MNASKENAAQALGCLERNQTRLTREDFAALKEFLEAAHKKLPTEEAYEREASRRGKGKDSK